MKRNLTILIVMSAMTCFSCGSEGGSTSVEFEEGYIEVTGGKVWYGLYGRSRPGIPLVVLHGGPGVPHNYLLPLAELADERPVLFYDQLGCGNSDTPDDSTLWNTSRFVEELKTVLTTLQFNEFHLLGQSWGTMLASEYLLKEHHKGAVSCVLSAPYLSTSLWVADQEKWISQLPEDVRETIRKHEESQDFTSDAYQVAMMVFYSKHVCNMDPWPDFMLQSMEKIGFAVYNQMWGASEFTMTGTLATADVTGDLHKINTPTLFTCGEFDEATPETTRYYQSLVSGAEMHVFKGASHSHHLESEEEYLGVVRQFLRKHDHR